MATAPQPLTPAEDAHKSVEVCDDGTSDALDEILERFDDVVEPPSAMRGVRG